LIALIYSLAAAAFIIQLGTLRLILSTARELPRHQNALLLLALTPFILICQGIMELSANIPLPSHAIEQATWSFLSAMTLIIGTLSLRSVLKTLAETSQALKKTAEIDWLTKFLRREVWSARVVQELTARQNNEECLVIFELDVDHFKRVNDKYGHEVGDEVLQSLANLCSRTLRDSDLWGRLGGEEFICALPRTRPEEAMEIVERLREAIAQHYFSTGQGGIHITVSIGMTAVEPGHEKRTDYKTHLRELIQQADKAMFAAKRSGRNCCKLVSAASDTTAPVE